MEIPITTHHMRARKILEEAVDQGKLKPEEAERYYEAWLRRRAETRRMAKHLRIPGDLREDPQGERIVRLLQLSSKEFNKACPPFGVTPPAHRDLPPVGKRMIRILGPTTHNRTAWKLLGMLVDANLMDYPTMMETYRIWGGMLKSATRREK